MSSNGSSSTATPRAASASANTTASARGRVTSARIPRRDGSIAAPVPLCVPMTAFIAQDNAGGKIFPLVRDAAGAAGASFRREAGKTTARSAPAVFVVKIRQDMAAHQVDDPQDF